LARGLPTRGRRLFWFFSGDFGMGKLLHNRGVQAGEHGEGYITQEVEHYTSAVPSGTYLSLAIASIGISLALQLSGRKHAAQFVGQWVPTILILGLYNKMVKQHGSN
jgi:hypothetical protein